MSISVIDSIKREIASLEAEIAEHKAIIESESVNQAKENITPEEMFLINCVFGSFENYARIGLDVIIDEQNEIAKKEIRIAKLKSYMA